MIIKSFCVYLMCFFCFVGFSQSHFNSQKIKELFELLPENCKQQFTKQSDLIECTVSGSGIILKCKKEGNVITHIGLNLFDQNDISIFPEEVYCFIERFFFEYLMTNDYSQFKTTAKDNRIALLYNGSDIDKTSSRKTTNIISLLTSDYAGISLKHDSLLYSFAVSDYKNSIDLVFPANNVLVNSMDKSELDDNLESNLKRHKSHTKGKNVPNVEMMKKTDDIYTLYGEVYYKSINADTYYKKVKNEYVLLFEKEYYIESLANVFFHSHKNPEKTVNIDHRKYGGVSSKYSLKLNDFLGFFSNNQFDVFFGLENGIPNSIEATVVFRNSYLNYINLIYIRTNLDDIFNENAINIKLYSNIPSDNIKDLYDFYFEEKLD